jgi:exopolysaccharide biosynthesis polyprenyl glycosylphosphotransferase
MKSLIEESSLLRNTAESQSGLRAVTHIVGRNTFKKLLLVVGDVAILYFSLYVSLVIRGSELPSREIWSRNLTPFTILFAVWCLVFYINDLYEIAISRNEFSFYSRILQSLFINFAIGFTYFYFLSSDVFDIKPQLSFVILAGVTATVLPLWRYWFNSFVEQPLLRRNVLVVGLNEGSLELIHEITQKPQLGYRISAVIDSEENPGRLELAGINVYDYSVDLKTVLCDENISVVVTAFDPRPNARLIQHLFESLALKLQFFELPTFYEKLTGKIAINSIGHIWFLENLAQTDKSLYEHGKRLFDLTFSFLLCLGSLPFLPLIALAIKLDSKGPVFFFQTRSGLLGRPFRAIKFRTMSVEAEGDGVARWAQKNDPRVTRVGRLLRKSRIDEIPQIWNVLRGEMSIIGPRPERPEFVVELERHIPFYNERHLVKPGLTGWAQIKFHYGSSISDSFKKLQYDFFYIKNRSVILDLAILLKTVNIVITAKGQ